uniref:Cysteine-rich receptor-like protein kinase n=1 Tax=Tanacetum cinerariifolium TaxID=118510 RepID=A0A6L2NIR9_TANCI|nr:cysteine-rich receptor-like protein kinase [Tanacetum cinerariifolium]
MEVGEEERVFNQGKYSKEKVEDKKKVGRRSITKAKEVVRKTGVVALGDNKKRSVGCVQRILRSRNHKASLWERLSRLMNRWQGAWCIFGDLNVVRRNGDWLNSQGKEVRSARPDCIFRDRLKNVKASLRVWSKERFGDHIEKIESLKNEAMKWELEAEKSVLTESEMSSWLEARKQWEVKDREYGNMLRQKARIKWGSVRNGAKWVDYCLRLASMSILVNGSLSEEFGLEMGVRQGDPLSPFLFILAAEGLNSIVSKAVEHGIFRGVVVGENKVTVSHLQYADDTTFSENGIKRMLNLSCAFSNVSKRCQIWQGGWVVVLGNSRLLTWGCQLGRTCGGGWGDMGFGWILGRLGKRLTELGLSFLRLVLGCWETGDILGFGLIDGLITEWVRSIRGRVSREYEEFIRIMQNIVDHNCKDKWRWTLGGDGEFAVKELARLIEEKVLRVENGGHKTLWNKLVPKKVNVFVWRVLIGRIPVRQNAVQNNGNEVGQIALQKPGIRNVENMNGLSVVPEIPYQHGNGNVVTTPAEGNGNGINGNPIRCYNCRGEGHYASNCIVKPRKRDAAYLMQQLQIAQEEEARIQSTQEEFEFMTTADAHEEIERVNVNYSSEDTLQQASTSGTQSDNASIYDSDGSAEVPKDENCYDNDIFNMLTQEVKYTDLQTELDRTKQKLETCVIKKEKEYATLWNDWYKKSQLGDLKSKSKDTPGVSDALDPLPQKLENENIELEFQVPSKSKSSCLSNNVEKIEENHRNSQIPKNQKHMSSECNNITLAIRNAKFKIVCVMCKQCLVTANHDVCVLNYVNDMNYRADNQSANVSQHENQKKDKANAKKSKELGSKGSLASSRPSKPRTCLSTSNPSEPSSEGFSNSASLLGRLSRLRKQHTSIYPIAVL